MGFEGDTVPEALRMKINNSLEECSMMQQHHEQDNIRRDFTESEAAEAPEQQEDFTIFGEQVRK